MSHMECGLLRPDEVDLLKTELKGAYRAIRDLAEGLNIAYIYSENDEVVNTAIGLLKEHMDIIRKAQGK